LSNQEKDINEIQQQVINDIKESGAILIYVNTSGDITLLTSGKITKQQSRTAERMLITINPSFVLQITLWLEITFVKLEDVVSSFLRKIFNV
tara:strand:- start:101 stop:376 length:276 start_codon:yes stop_codon:yes gene_type:complete